MHVTAHAPLERQPLFRHSLGPSVDDPMQSIRRKSGPVEGVWGNREVPPTPNQGAAPPAGLEPAASGLRVRRHLPFDHGGMQLRRQGSNLRLAINSRASYRSTTPERKEGEGVEPPRACARPVFETGYRAGGSPSKGDSGRLRTCTSPIKSRELCPLSYGAKSVAGRHRTCAPRGSGGRSTVLSYGHMYGRGWSRTSDLLFVRQALSRLSYSPVSRRWAELDSNQRRPPYQRGARPTELPAREASGRGLEPRSPRSERGVLPLDDPEMSCCLVRMSRPA
jgi:hypothetical protein